MKTINYKSMLLGASGILLLLTLTSGKLQQSSDNITFLSTPTGVGIYNKSSKTIYLYKVTGMSVGIQETPTNVYKVADDGSSLTKQ